MTATPATTALTALQRADRVWCKDTADEPLDETRLDHLTAAVQAQLDSAAPAVDVDEHQAELDRVRAFEEQRREDLRVELWKHIHVQERRAERAEHQRNTWKGEYDRVVDSKVVELAEALEERDTARAERDQALAELARVHRHAWDVQPGLKDMGLPCACGRPWPRNRPPDIAP